jgi:hypothetical protein
MAVLVLRPDAGFGRPSSNGRVKESWLNVHVDLDRIEVPFSKLGVPGDFCMDLNPLRNEILLFWLESLLLVFMFRQILEIGLGNILLMALIGSARKSSWVSVVLHIGSASTICRRRIEPSCFGLSAPLLLLAPVGDEKTFSGSSRSQFLSQVCVPGAAEELSNLSQAILWKLLLWYTDISVLQSVVFPL